MLIDELKKIPNETLKKIRSMGEWTNYHKDKPEKKRKRTPLTPGQIQRNIKMVKRLGVRTDDKTLRKVRKYVRVKPEKMTQRCKDIIAVLAKNGPMRVAEIADEMNDKHLTYSISRLLQTRHIEQDYSTKRYYLCSDNGPEPKTRREKIIQYLRKNKKLKLSECKQLEQDSLFFMVMGNLAKAGKVVGGEDVGYYEWIAS